MDDELHEVNSLDDAAWIDDLLDDDVYLAPGPPLDGYEDEDEDGTGARAAPAMIAEPEVLAE